MTAKLTDALRRAPATVPAMAAIVLLVVWASDQAGYPLTHWAPGGVFVLALLGIAAVLVGRPAGTMPPTVAVALACLAAYTALSFLSILWASAPGEAWEGADRTLLYLAIFALFAAWPQKGPTAAALLLVWVLALTGLAVHALAHVGSAGPSDLAATFPSGRLLYPSGYPNANAAEWLMAAWPALLMARSERLHWALRGLLAGSAVLLADVALLSQSRGSLYATPVMVVLVLAFVPRRVRTFWMLVPVAAGVAAAAPSILRVGDHLSHGVVTAANVHAAVRASSISALAVAVLVAAAAMLEHRLALSGPARSRVRQGFALVAAVAVVAVVAGGLAAAGDPVARARSAWHSFKGGYGDSSGSSRLVSGLGSNRYDFYRVALDEFLAHPLLGIGVDNFQQQYLRHGRSSETPRYPHSVELRTLTQTGLLGGALALAGLVAALLAIFAAMRGPDPLSAAVAAGAAAAFAYWAVHGSVDWFWEFAGLGAPAFAMLGLGCSLAPLRRAAEARKRAPARRRRIAAIAAGLAGAVMAAALVLPWLSRLQVQEAVRVWTVSRSSAYSRLASAAGLDRLSSEPYDLAGSIALRYGELDRADDQFAKALERSPDDVYAVLERGAIASARGQRARALALLERAHALAPREAVIAEALAVVRSGRRISIPALNRAILLKGRQLA